MVDAAEAVVDVDITNTEEETMKFGGTPRNLVPGMAILLAGVLAFFMNMTHVFFAEAMAWVFIVWGLLLIYVGLSDINKTYEITDEALIIRNLLRPWVSTKVWDWGYINRMDVVTHKKDNIPSEATMQVYCAVEGELAVLREDRSFNPVLAQEIIERADLKPGGTDNPTDMVTLPLHQDKTYSWQ